MASTVTAASSSHGRVLNTRIKSSKPVTAWSRPVFALPVQRVQQSSARARVAVVRASTDRATWLPGLDSPSYLDGTSVIWHSPLQVLSFSCIDRLADICLCWRLPGDFGFDPLGLGEEPAALKWYVQAELVHCRFAMLGVAGILFTDVSCSPSSCPSLPNIISLPSSHQKNHSILRF
jgi:light-harvesting complex I chlorophyll a/b binding protein 5